ncbi:MAG: hypothetical protein JSW06_10120 [Thermoplasmatales archaeon]|nr:MAG: hypothetical protein JSW06_10120 [Thermoplasmatales archaeon]
MKKSFYVLAVTLVIATLVISSTASIPITKHTKENNNLVSDYESTPKPLATKTDYFSIPAAAFNPEGSSTTYSIDGTYLNGVGEFFAPVYLPSKATVTKLLFFWADYNGPEDGTVRLKRYAFGASASTMAEASTSGSTGSGASEDNSIDNAEIDNSQYSYFVVFDVPSAVIICNNVIIEYNYEPVIVPESMINEEESKVPNMVSK